MHKSKENASGTFSIGKTWNLDDLTQIESYTGPQVNSSFRDWAGDTGFLVMLGKPYFWQAQTDKEKKFFIASLIKIYGKYTGGKTPELSGFDTKELDQVLGAGRRPTGPQRPLLPELAPGSSITVTQVPTASTASPESVVDIQRFQKPTPIRSSQNGANSPAGSFDSTTSKERPPPRWGTQSNKSQDSVANSFITRSDEASSLPLRSRHGVPGVGPLSSRLAETRASPEPSHEISPPQVQGSKAPPERRRPPMDPSRPQDRDLVPPPLMSPTAKRDMVAPPPRSTDRMSPQRRQATQDSDSSSSRKVIGGLDVSASSMGELENTTPQFPDTANASAPDSTPHSQLPDDAPSDAALPGQETGPTNGGARPGLGPMIKTKMSKGEIAGTFWKAASAATAFRPRPGGAGERLRQAKNKFSDGPDGITSVVPAPPRPISTDKNQPVWDQKAMECNSIVPEVKITVPNSSRPSSMQGPVQDATKALESPKSGTRRSVAAGQDAKYLQFLGVEPAILNDRSEEFCKWLDFFGWVPGGQMRYRSIEDIKGDLERELNTAQAGGWLSRFREEDERVDAIKHGIDTAIAECEELDNLLTLYSVELSVCCVVASQPVSFR